MSEKIDTVAPARRTTPASRISALFESKMLGWIALAIALLVPFIIATPYALNVMTTAAIFVLLASGLNIVVGYCGLLDLGYIAFMAVGAYTSGIIAKSFELPLIFTIPAVLVMTILAGLIIGAPTLRLRSDYLAIVTLGLRGDHPDNGQQPHHHRWTVRHLRDTRAAHHRRLRPAESCSVLLRHRADRGGLRAGRRTARQVSAGPRLAIRAGGRGRGGGDGHPHLQGEADGLYLRRDLGRCRRHPVRLSSLGRVAAELHLPPVGAGADGSGTGRNGQHAGSGAWSARDQSPAGTAARLRGLPLPRVRSAARGGHDLPASGLLAGARS